MGEPASCGAQRATARTRTLEVYAMSDCPGWHRAVTLAAMAQRAEIPDIEVVVRDMSSPDTRAPESVVASPTWVLDGRRIALGNPDAEWLLERLGAPTD